MTLQNETMTLLDEIAEADVAKALLIRRVEQKFLDLFSDGKLFGTVHTCIGQELTAVAIAKFLKDEDWIFSNHRCHGHFIAKTGLVEGLISEIMGKQTGVCGGWGGSQHLCAKRFFSNGIQGGILPVAAGLALAEKYRQTSNIAVVFMGEGTLGEGVVYETANIASKWDIPLLFVIENNYYSQSTSQDETHAGNITARFEAFGIRCFETNCWDATHLFKTVGKAVAHTQKKQKATFLRIETYRLKAHSKGDDDREPQEVESYWKNDLLEQFCKQHPEKAKEILTPIDAHIEQAVNSGLQAPFTQNGDHADPTLSESCSWEPTTIETRERIGQAICDCFKQHMDADSRILMIGEDIRSPYGGAFKVTKGLSDHFPDRVRNTPISEAAIVGVGNGLALNGMRPACEIMFGDFMTLTFDQIVNHASKFFRMYNDQVKVPLIVRTPMGGGRGYGPTHSQSIEKHFLGLPQTLVLALHKRIHPSKIYDPLFESIDRLTLVIENKLLYAERLSSQVPEGFVLEHSNERYPTSRIRPEGKADFTIACYGGTLSNVEDAILKAFDELEIACEVICPTQLYPLNPAPILESVLRTRRLLIVEEGLSFAAWGSELATRIFELCPGGVDVIKRCSAPAHPIPSCGPLEKEILPNKDSILGFIRDAYFNSRYN
jgi:2-oxoisovalerate dehydrogenase E1 component